MSLYPPDMALHLCCGVCNPVGVSSAVNSRQNQPVVVVTQPAPVPISLMCLRDSPGLICCPYCRHTVTTKVTYVPGATAWFLCVLLTLMGLVCGFCLIPLMIHRLHEAHHSCPRCGNHLHVYTR
uniref:LITAF domain-containing protein n=1 Tax=Echeneis naucrates TaxID=173247 RepID=A0A665W7J2_ECHNA